jgi:hypothetical protein
MSSGDKTKLDGIASGANNYTHPNHSGDVTSSGDGATTIANDVVTNAKLANMAQSTLKGRATASTGDPEDLSASSVRTLLNTDQVSDARTPLSHTHGNLTNDGKIGTTANLPLKTGTNGVVEAGSFGTSAGSFCAGDDARLSDDRDPNLHAASHLAGAPAIAASYTGIGDNETFGDVVTITATTAGTAGNSITLAFDGVDDVDTVLSAWNSANPSNQATLDSGDGEQIPEDGDSLQLSGGVAAIVGGSDPFANINQDLGTADTPEFAGLTVDGTAAAGQTPDTVLRGGAWLGAAEGEFGLGVEAQPIGSFGSDSKFISFTGYNEAVTAYNPLAFAAGYYPQVFLHTTGKVGIQTSDPQQVLDVAGNIALRDTDNEFAATFDVQNQLSDDVTLTIPDQSGTLAVVTDIPTTAGDVGAVAAGAITTSGLTQSTARILGRTTASTGAVEELAASDVRTFLNTDELSATRTPTSHAHGNITNAGAIGSTSGLPLVTTTAGAVTTLALGTAGQILRTKSDLSGVEFADPAASGVTGAASSASDILGVSGANITGVDATADRIVFWDDSASALKYLEAGSGLSISGTTMTASGGASIMQAIAVGFVLN